MGGQYVCAWHASFGIAILAAAFIVGECWPQLAPWSVAPHAGVWHTCHTMQRMVVVTFFTFV